MLLADAFGRVILPLGSYQPEDNVPGRATRQIIEWSPGEPGVRHGQ